jgi:hypothetical protein
MMLKLKNLLNEGYWSGGFKGSGRTWHPSKEDIAKEKERRANRDLWFKEKIKNPKTGNEVSITTALSYPSNHPAHIAAVKMGKEKFKVSGFGYSNYFDRKGKPLPKKEKPKETPEEPYQNIFGKLKSLVPNIFSNNKEK